ncbi:MAG: DUF2075 domain-containing protein [Deltaproteobacteria bacterium]|nr:DUF2075 domain-containing protein [Deltaproteobacteria bacterium]
MKKISTGISGLDEMLNGGVPKKRICLVTGGPGVGKTILGLQFLVNGAHQNEIGLFVSLEENPSHIIENALGFNWDFKKNYEEKVKFVDASPLQTLHDEIKIGEITIGSEQFSFATLVSVIKKEAYRIKPKRIVLDSLTALLFQFDNNFDRRRATLELFQCLNELDATCIVTSELRSYSPDRELQVEEYLAQGVILLATLPNGIRTVHIEKMRGTSHDLNTRPYQIGEKGIEVFPKETVTVPSRYL